MTVGYTDDGKSLVVKWEPYKENGVLLIDSIYEIQYRPAGSKDPEVIRGKIISGTSNQTIQGGITDEQNYEVRDFFCKSDVVVLLYTFCYSVPHFKCFYFFQL